MEPVQFLSMVNSIDEVTKSNLNKMPYENEGRNAGFNIGGNIQSIGANPPIFRDSNPLCDEIRNTEAFDVQVEPIFDSYSGEGDPMIHIKAFEMKFELKLGVNNNLMAKCFPATLRGDALNWYFSLSAKSINCYAQLVSNFYMHFKHKAPREVIIYDLMNTKQRENEILVKFAQTFQNIWSMIKDPLLETHVKAIFVHNINLGLSFIAINYVDFYFSNIVHKLIKKEEFMVEMEKLKYDTPSKDQKKPYQKKEDKHV